MGIRLGFLAIYLLKLLEGKRATVEQDVRGWKLARAHTAALQGQTGGAARKVRRRYLTPDGMPALLTVSIYPAERFSIKTTLTKTRIA